MKCLLAATMKLISLVLFVTAPLAAQSLFTQTTNPPFNPGLGAFNGVARDLNNDGNLDLVFMDEANGNAAVLLGDGHGAFTRGPANQCNGAQPVAILAADFNGDGNMDIALESSLAGPNFLGQGSIQICLGDGNGGLSPYAGNSFFNPVLTGGGTGSMATGDFNGDGIPDMVISNENGLIVLLGDGKGGFQRGASPSGRGSVSALIAVGDFTGRLHSDIVAINSEGLTVLVSDGKGGFSALPIIGAFPGGGMNIVVGDLNNDGFTDLVAGNSVLLGDGKGGFTAPKSLPINAGQTRQAFSLADFNGDGNLDLAITDGRNASILFGVGDGSFNTQPAAQFALQAAAAPNFGFAADVDNDGKPDYVLSDGRVWLNTAPAITVQPRNISLSTATAPVALTVSGATGLVNVVLNQPWLTYSNEKVGANTTGLAPGVYHCTMAFSAPGDFGATVQVTLTVSTPSGAITASSGTPPSTIGTPYTGDFNGDGKPDLLIYDGTTARVWFGDGAGNFKGAAATVTLPIVSFFAVADFNLDGNLDFAVTQISGTIQVWLGDGMGGFASGPTTAFLPYPYSLGFPSPTVVDFNLDGNPDLLVSGLVFLGDGKGGFHEILPTTQPGQSYGVAIGDFNGDGIPDVAYTELASSFVYIWLGDGKGALKLIQRYDFSIGDPVLGVITTDDFNGDGTLDLAIASVQHPGTIEMLYGDGTGTFQHGTGLKLAQSTPINALLTADFNGDGYPDLAAVNSQGQTTILLGNGQAGFTASPGGTLPVGTGAVVADFNSDGRPDIAGVGSAGWEILLGGLARPTITLKQVPPSPFDIGQTVTLMTSLVPDPYAFQGATGQISLSDGGSLIGTAALGNGTAYITAPYVAQTHNFTATYSGDVRSAPAMGSLTVVESGTPAAIQALGNGFPLKAMVIDANNNPIAGVAVTFSAPASGPGGSFVGGATVLTDSRGIATAPLFVANGVAGDYIITATTTIGSVHCVFQEMN